MKRLKCLGKLAALLVGAAGGVTLAQPMPISACGSVSASGSYQLTANLSASGDCLVLTGAANVDTVIDLGGFTISGNGSGSGIRNDSIVEGLTIRNGTIRGFDTGISIYGNTILVERMSVRRNTTYGFSAAENVRIKDSFFEGNGVGAEVGEGAVVIGSLFSFNTSDGLQVSALGLGPGSLIANNTAIRNGGVGMRVACPGNIQGNTLNANTGGNLVVSGAGCLSEHNVAP